METLVLYAKSLLARHIVGKITHFFLNKVKLVILWIITCKVRNQRYFIRNLILRAGGFLYCGFCLSKDEVQSYEPIIIINNVPGIIDIHIIFVLLFNNEFITLSLWI